MQEQAGAAGRRYDVFISYSRKDESFVAHLERMLEAYKPPASLVEGRRRLEVFRDAQDLTGPDYNQSIRDFLRRSAKLLVVCSPHARQSTYVDQEIEWFLQTHESTDVFALLLDGLPNNEVEAEDPRRAFPSQLCKAHTIPLAADYRGFDEKRHKAAKPPFDQPWYTLLANIYSIDRTTLEQRARQRRRSERRIVAAIAGSVMIGLAAAAIFSWAQMKRAEEQRNVAVKGFARYLAMHSEQAGPAAPDTGLLLAIEAARATRDLDNTVTAEAQSALRNALSRSGGTRLDIGTRGLRFSPEGRWLAQMEDQGTVTVWELAGQKGRAARTTQLQTELLSLQTGPAGRLAVLTKNPYRLALLDIGQFEQPPRWIEPRVGPIQSLHFSSDGAALVIVDQTADIISVDLSDPTSSPRLLRGHTLRRNGDELLGIKGVALSSSGRWMASAGWDNRLLLWDRTQPGAEPLQLLADVGIANPQFSADGRWLHVASRATDESKPDPPSLWYLSGSTPVPVAIERDTTPGDSNVVRLTTVPTDRFMTGDRLIASSGGATLVWKLTPSQARIERRIPGTLAAVDGWHVVTILQRSAAPAEFVISLWDVDSTAANAEAEVQVDSTVHAVGYTARGRALVALTDANELWSWHLDEHDFDAKPRRYTNVIGNQLQMAPSGQEVIVGNWYDTARLWNLQNPSRDPVRLSNLETNAELRREMKSSAFSSSEGGLPKGGLQQMLAFDGVGQRVAMPHDGGTVGMVDLQHPNRTPAVLPVREDDAVSAVAFSPDGKLVAAGDNELNVHVWPTRDITEPFALLRVPEREGYTSSLTALLFSHSGKLLAASNGFGTVAVWNLTTPTADPLTLTHHKGWVTSLAFSQDDRNLLMAAEDGKASVVSVAEPTAFRMLDGHVGAIRAAFSAADKFIITAGEDATVRVWPTEDVMNGAKLEPRILRGHSSPIITFALVPQQQRLITASEESLRVWDLGDAGRAPQVILLREPLGIVTVSHDGQWLAAADLRGGIELRRMDALDQPPLRMPAPLAQDVHPEARALRFSPDDRWLTALTPGQGWMWRMRPDELLQLACEATGRNFEVPEWEQYLSDVPYRFTCPQWGLGPNYLKYARQEAERTAVDHAARLLGRAKELVPDLPYQPTLEATRLAVASVLKHGRQLARNGHTDAALIQLGRVREIDPTSSFDPVREIERLRQASELVVKANALAQTGKIEPAIETFRQALALDPSRGEPDPDDPQLGLDPVQRANQIYAEVVAKQGLALAAEGRMKEAIEHLKHALRLDPNAISDTPEAEARSARAQALAAKAQKLAAGN